MKNISIRILSILFCLALLLSSVSCKSDSKKAEESNPKPNSSVSDKVDPDLSSEEEPLDESGNIEVGEGEENIPPADRPFTDGIISVGYFEGEPYNGELDDGDPWEDFENIDSEIDEEIYEPFVQMEGEKVQGSKRTIYVDNSKALFKGFRGFGCNVFPTQFTYAAQVKSKDIPAYVEITAERFEAIDCSYARSWFQIDWMITDEAGEDYKKYENNPEDNPDAKNYYNGVYDFDNEKMQSAIEYWKMLEEAETEIYLAFGWKIGTRVQDWFGACPAYPDMATPRDLNQYADAAAALFKYCRNEVGLTNFNTLSYYNEPHMTTANHDFNTIGDKRIVFVKMLEAAHKVFDNDPELQDVEFIVADDAWDLDIRSEDYVNIYLNEYAAEYVDIFSHHCYATVYDGIQKGEAYQALFDRLLGSYYYYKKPLWITEYYNGTKDDINGDYNWDALNGWNASFASFFVASANNGVAVLLKWGCVGGYLIDPQNFDVANGATSSWIRPKNETTLNKVNMSFYEESLLSNYVKNDSSVNYLEWKGDDIRCSAFTSKDGKDFTLVVEANEKTSKKELDITLKKAINKDVNVFRFGFDVPINAQASVIANEARLENVTTRIKYQISGDYGIYVFTTYKPLDQLEVYKEGTDEDAVYLECNDESVSIEPRFVDNFGYQEPEVNDSSVSWEIKQYSEAVEVVDNVEQKIVRREKTDPQNCGKLTVAKNGVATYTPADNAKKGDIIALRCSYKDGDDTAFATVIVEID